MNGWGCDSVVELLLSTYEAGAWATALEMLVTVRVINAEGVRERIKRAGVISQKPVWWS